MTSVSVEPRYTSTLILPRWHERPDLLIHALAQLPDQAVLTLSVDSGAQARMELLARAYGITDRVVLNSDRSESPPGNGRAVFHRSSQGALGHRAITVLAVDEFGARGAGSIESMVDLVEELSLPHDAPASCRRTDELLSGQRVAIVTNLPAHYRIPLFEQIAGRLAEADATLRVFFMSGRAGERSWMTSQSERNFDHEVLSGVALRIRERPPHVPFAIVRRLRAFGPTLILSAGFSPAISGRIAAFARRAGCTFGLWSGEIPGTRTARSPIRRLQRRRLITRADFAVAYGSLAGEYLRGLAPALLLVHGRNTSATRGARTRDDEVSQTELLAVGDLASPRKGSDILLGALELLPDLPCRLTFAGGGRLLDSFRERAKGDPRIRFAGPVAASDMQRLYSGADGFLFPSREDVFGLALVEAMGSGLAVATSRNPGAVADLVRDGVTGLVVDSHEPAAWASAIQRLVLEPELRRALGRAAETTVARRWTLDHAAEAMIAGLRLGVLMKAQAG